MAENLVLKYIENEKDLKATVNENKEIKLIE